MKRALRSLAVVGYLAFTALGGEGVGAFQTAAPDPLQPLTFLLGPWEGTSDGQPGTGRLQREYSHVLNARFIQAHNQSVYQPQEKNPKGEVHERFGPVQLRRHSKAPCLPSVPQGRFRQPVRPRPRTDREDGVHHRSDRKHPRRLARARNVRPPWSGRIRRDLRARRAREGVRGVLRTPISNELGDLKRSRERRR